MVLEYFEVTRPIDVEQEVVLIVQIDDELLAIRLDGAEKALTAGEEVDQSRGRGDSEAPAGRYVEAQCPGQ